MSVWKKASKAHQKTHRERHQPEERKHLGLLEKKKDYVVRAKDYNEKQATLKLLRRRALNKNPDEFYHHMINSKLEDGKHFEKEKAEEDTPEQLKLMRTQDLKYIIAKRTQERKKIERLQAKLHLSSVQIDTRNKHTFFSKKAAKEAEEKRLEALAREELPDLDVDALEEATKKSKNLYKELAKRIERERQLAVTQEKLEMHRHLESGKHVLPPKRVRRGNKDSAPVYVWKYERKRWSCSENVWFLYVVINLFEFAAFCFFLP